MEINFSYSKIPFIFGERMALEMQICAVLSQLDMKCGGKKSHVQLLSRSFHKIHDYHLISLLYGTTLWKNQ